MSKEQKEEGTSHYRSGIYDVVSVPAKERTKSSNVIVREDYSDIREVLFRLTANIEENTKAVRALHAHLNAGGDRSLKRRSDRVTVYVRVAFLRIIDIDTKDGTYTADVYIQASWLEPSLKSANQQELDDLDYDQVWKPNIIVTNMAGTPQHMQRWYGGCRPVSGQKVPLLYLRIALRGKFKENLELGAFPVDTQDLNVTVGSERSEAEINLTEDMGTVNMATFQDQSEFNLHPHVEVTRLTGHMQGLDIYERSPKLNFACNVTRRPSFYFWNMFLVLFLITGLMFVTYIFEPDQADMRMKVSLTLLLIVVAYKLVLVKEMPKIPFMSLLGGYMLTCLMFVVWQTIQNAIIELVFSAYGKAYAMEVDWYMFIISLMVYILFNLIYVCVILIKFFMTKRNMSTKNSNYNNRLRHREAGRGQDDPSYYTHTQEYRNSVPRNYVDPSIPPPEESTKSKRRKSKHRRHRESSTEVEIDTPAYTYDNDEVFVNNNKSVYISKEAKS